MQVRTRNEGGARCVADVLCGRCDDWGVSPCALRGPGDQRGMRRCQWASTPAGQILGEQRVGEVVAPVAVDVQVAAQQALLAEAQALDEALAGQVLRPDVGLHAVQAHLPNAWSQTSATASEAMPRPATDRSIQ